MRSIPIDLARCTLVGTGKVSPKAEYVALSDGSTRASGNQAKDEATGLPLWVVDCLVDDDEARRAEIVGVTVPCADEPTPAKYRPVAFRNVTARIYTDRASGRPAVSLVAEGIEQAGVKPIAAAS